MDSVFRTFVPGKCNSASLSIHIIRSTVKVCDSYACAFTLIYCVCLKYLYALIDTSKPFSIFGCGCDDALSFQ